MFDRAGGKLDRKSSPGSIFSPNATKFHPHPGIIFAEEKLSQSDSIESLIRSVFVSLFLRRKNIFQQFCTDAAKRGWRIDSWLVTFSKHSVAVAPLRLSRCVLHAKVALKAEHYGSYSMTYLHTMSSTRAW
jgi:hypothetical protein